MFKVAFVTLGTAFVFAASIAAAQVRQTPRSNGADSYRHEPGAQYHDRDARYNRRDIKYDRRDIRRDRRDLARDQRVLMWYRAHGDWNGMRRAEADIQRDRRDIARDRRDRHMDRCD